MRSTKELTVGKRIMLLRKERRFTREELAERADISYKFLYEIENDTKNFSASTLERLSDALGVSMDFIMKGRKNTNGDLVITLERYKPDTLKSVEQLLLAACEIVSEDVQKQWNYVYIC